MEKRVLGRTGLKISPLSFGAMELWQTDQKQADILLNAALDHGINYIDTSREYVRSEERIGNAISHRRSEYILATKCCDNMTGVGPMYTYDRKTCLSNLEESLIITSADKGVGIIARGVLKKYKKNYDELFEKSGIAELFEENETRSDFLVRYALTNQSIASMAIGTKSCEHLFNNLKVIEKGCLLQDVYEETKRRLDNAGITAGEV